MARFLLLTNRRGVPWAILIIHRIHNSEEHNFSACSETDSSWNQTMIHYWPQFFSVSEILKNSVKPSVALICLAMQDWLYFPTVPELLENTGFDEDNLDSRNIETFSCVLRFLPELTSICRLTNMEHRQIASSLGLTNILSRLKVFYCINQWLGRNGLLHLLLD